MMTFFRTLIQQIGPNKKGLIRILQVLSQPSGKAGALVSAIGGMLRLSPSQTTQITGEVILISGVVLLAIDDGTSG